MKPLLVGELNPYGPSECYALYPEPEGSAGHRLCTKILGLSCADYLERFDRVNLCTRKWSMPVARRRAQELCDDGEHEVFVLLGAKVAQAFLPRAYEPFVIREHCDRTFVVLPHPSGLSRGWRRPGAFQRARQLLCGAGVLPQERSQQ